MKERCEATDVKVFCCECVKGKHHLLEHRCRCGRTWSSKRKCPANRVYRIVNDTKGLNGKQAVCDLDDCDGVHYDAQHKVNWT